MSEMQLRMEAESGSPQELPTLQGAVGYDQEGIIKHSQLGKYGFDLVSGYPLCKRGHVRSPDNTMKGGECRICRYGKNKQWRDGNKEKVKKQKAASYLRTKEKVLARAKKYQTTNKDRIKEQKADYYLRNKEAVVSSVKKYRIANSEKIKEQKAEYRLKNSGRIKMYNKARRKSNPDYYKAERKSRYLSDRETAIKKALEWCRLNPGRVKKSQARYRLTHPEKIKTDNERARDMLSPHYIATSLKMSVKELTPAVIELKRMMIKLTRAKRAYLKGEIHEQA